MEEPLSWSEQIKQPYNGPVACRCCGDTAQFATPEHAHAAGWDVEPYFTVAPLCTRCLSALYLRDDCRHDQESHEPAVGRD